MLKYIAYKLLTIFLTLVVSAIIVASLFCIVEGQYVLGAIIGLMTFLVPINYDPL